MMRNLPQCAVPFDQVQLTDGFWRPRQVVNREQTLPHVWRMFEQDGRFTNFERAAKRNGAHQGFWFNDGLFYSAIEGMCYILADRPDAEWQQRLDAAIAAIAAAQEPDGYLNTYFTLNLDAPRWSDLLFAHELYNAGMLFQAAAANFELRGNRRLLDVAERLAAHIRKVFGPDGRPGYPGHPAIEMGLLALHRATGQSRYLDMARFFVEVRGRSEAKEQMYSGWSVLGPEPEWPEFAVGEGRHYYMQAHVPVREQNTIEGHAVRATYLYAAVAELAALTGDQGYATALERIWQDMVTRKMYLTGGIGVWGHGEGFSAGYDLPNEEAYAETCAAIGLVFWSHRMYLLTGEARFVDVLERVLYNVVAAGVSLDGDKFFYVNPLASRGVATFEAGGGSEPWIVSSGHHRRHWFQCACCPPNALRFLPKVGEYIYALDDRSITVNLYIASRAQAEVGGRPLQIVQDTRFPWDGFVRLHIEVEQPMKWSLRLRAPDWCPRCDVAVNGDVWPASALQDGYMIVERTWQSGDVVELHLAMPVQIVSAHPRVAANRGRLALQRGPLVYCAEGVDNGGSVFNLTLPRTACISPEYRPDMLGGVTVLRGRVPSRADEDWDGLLYAPAGDACSRDLVAVPYAVWDNREPGEMQVWFPESPSLAETVPPAS